jgi:hypothetical protein
LAPKYNLAKEKKERVKQISLLFRPQLNCFSELVILSDYFFVRPTIASFEIPLPLLEKMISVKNELLNLNN